MRLFKIQKVPDFIVWNFLVVYRVELDKNADDIPAEPSDDLTKLEWVGLARLSNYKLTPPSLTLLGCLGYINKINAS